VAGSDELWDWIIRRLEETHPNRNYNRAVNIPESYEYIPSELQKLENLVEGKIDNILHPEIKRVKNELEAYQGFIEDISEYEQDLYDDFEEILNGNGKTKGYSGNSNSAIGVDTPDTQATKNWLKKITKDLIRLVNKYGGKRLFNNNWLS
jgi:hypothetical protein